MASTCASFFLQLAVDLVHLLGRAGPAAGEAALPCLGGLGQVELREVESELCTRHLARLRLPGLAQRRLGLGEPELRLVERQPERLLVDDQKKLPALDERPLLVEPFLEEAPDPARMSTDSTGWAVPVASRYSVTSLRTGRPTVTFGGGGGSYRLVSEQPTITSTPKMVAADSCRHRRASRRASGPMFRRRCHHHSRQFLDIEHRRVG